MKTYALVGGVLLAGVLAWGPAWGQEPLAPPPPPEHARALDAQWRKIELERQQSELHFQNEMRNLELEKKRQEIKRAYPPPGPRACERGMQRPCPGPCHGGKHRCLWLAWAGIVNILLTVWVYGDIRRRQTGSGLWLVLTLLGGFFGALLYALVRLGDKPAA